MKKKRKKKIRKKLRQKLDNEIIKRENIIIKNILIKIENQ